MTQNTPFFPQKKRKLEPWPIAFFVFFAIIIAVNLTMIYLGKNSWTGVVTASAYEKGLAFNQIVQAQKAQDQLHWQLKLEHNDFQAGKDQKILLSLRDQEGNPIQKASIDGLLYRPTQEGFDQTFQLQVDPVSGLYSGQITIPQPGKWDIKIHAVAADGEYRFIQRINAKAATKKG
ncbi:MAG: FixH family protein [Magnetococcus sp. DMHC-6]